MLTEITSGILGFVGGILSHAAGTWAYEHWKGRKSNRHLRKLLNFHDPDSLVFVFPPRDPTPRKSLLPHVAIEDFAAVNNVVGALAQVEWRGPVHARDPDHFLAGRMPIDFVTICSPRSNRVTEKVLSDFSMKYAKLPRFRPNNHGEWEIDANGAVFNSPSFTQEKNIQPNSSLQDHAIIAKLSDSIDPKLKILVVAGIRGIGTWGAAEYLRKHSAELYRRKGFDGSSKTGDFACVIGVTYQNFDITHVELKHFVDLS